MMNESHQRHWDDDDLEFGMELQSFVESATNARPQRIVLTPPPEWLDPKEPLPTDKEFHRWISEQLRARINNTGVDSQRQRQRNSQSSFTDSDDVSSCNSGSSRLSVIRKKIQNVGFFGGILRKRGRERHLMEQQTFLLEDDCFAAANRESGVVGMELSVIS
jgi:hypothetical protein